MKNFCSIRCGCLWSLARNLWELVSHHGREEGRPMSSWHEMTEKVCANNSQRENNAKWKRKLCKNWPDRSLPRKKRKVCQNSCLLDYWEVKTKGNLGRAWLPQVLGTWICKARGHFWPSFCLAGVIPFHQPLATMRMSHFTWAGLIEIEKEQGRTQPPEKGVCSA